MAVDVQTLVWPSCATSWCNDNTGTCVWWLSSCSTEGLLAQLATGAASGLWVLTLAALSPAVSVPARGLSTGHRSDPAAGRGHHPPGGRPGLSGHRAQFQRPAAGTALHPPAAAHGCRGAAGRQVMLTAPPQAPVGPSPGLPGCLWPLFVELTPVFPSVPPCLSPVARWRACTLPAFPTSWTTTGSQWKSQSQWSWAASTCAWRKLTLYKATK